MMKKLLALFVLVALTAAVTGCTPAAPPDISGLIYSVEGNNFLVVEGIDSTDIPYEEWFENFHNAIFFKVNSDTVLQKGGKKISFDQLETGQKVEVWSTGVLEDSYPQGGIAKKVVVIERE